MSQPVQNLSKFSFKIKIVSVLSVERGLLLSLRMVGRPSNKCQSQSLAGHIMQLVTFDRLLFAYFCEASSVNTECGNSVSCIKGIKL